MENMKDTVATTPEQEIDQISDINEQDAEIGDVVAVVLSKTAIRMKQRLSEIHDLVQKWNEANQEDRVDDARKLNSELTEAIDEYNGLSWVECRNNLLATDDPMLSAVRKLTYTCIKIKDENAEGTDIIVRDTVNVERFIDLLKLHKNTPIGRDKDWAYRIEKLNFVMTAAKAKSLGVDPRDVNDSYAMSQIAKAIDLGETPCSNTNMLKTLQSVVTAMVGDEYKANSHDVAFLKSVYSKHGKRALTVACSNHKVMRQYCMEVCHRIVCGEKYSIDFKRTK